MNLRNPRRILIIRRDNIGDLICTTPLFRALRETFPHAYIAALVNSYNAPVLAGNEAVDRVFVYTKAKHASSPVDAVKALAARLGLYWNMRREKFDVAIAAGSCAAPRAVRLARLAGAKTVVGYDDPNARGPRPDALLAATDAHGRHEVENVYALAASLGVSMPIPKMEIFPDEDMRRQICHRLGDTGAQCPSGQMTIGVHISARKPTQRWPEERFVQLLREITASPYVRVLLFWAPGDESNAQHPGDNQKAERILSAISNAAVHPCPTNRLEELIAGLSLCDYVICSDGGAMHIAAALGKPIVCLFGQSDATRWYPWGVPHTILQPASRDVKDVTVNEVVSAYRQLISPLGGVSESRFVR